MKRKMTYALIVVLIMALCGLTVWSTLEPEGSFTGYLEELRTRLMIYLAMSSIPVDPCPPNPPSFIKIMLTPSGRDKPDKADPADGVIDPSAE
jgi:hypothetical protein